MYNRIFWEDPKFTMLHSGLGLCIHKIAALMTALFQYQPEFPIFTQLQIAGSIHIMPMNLRKSTNIPVHVRLLRKSLSKNRECLRPLIWWHHCKRKSISSDLLSWKRKAYELDKKDPRVYINGCEPLHMGSRVHQGLILQTVGSSPSAQFKA